MAAKEVKIALVTYVDEMGEMQTTLAAVGSNHVQILNAKSLGVSDSTSNGLASEWLKKGIFEKLGK